MNRLTRMFIGLGFLLPLSACSGSNNCESVVKRINEIEQEIERNRESLSDHTPELQVLAEKMQELKCYEAILDDALPDQ